VPEALVVQIMRQHKAFLVGQQAMQMLAMSQRWLAVERALMGQAELLAVAMLDEKQAGRSISQTKLFRMGRYQELMQQLQEQVNIYNQYSEMTIEQAQRLHAVWGIDHSSQSIVASYATAGAVVPTFSRLSIDAVENMVGLLGDGSPLRTLLVQAYGDAAAGASQALVNGTALGWPAAKTAAAMRDGLARGLGRELTIARTEQIRVYREATRMQYAESEVVEGFIRLAAHDKRTCLACLASEGEWFELRESLYDHPNGRCTAVPKIVGIPIPEMVQGADWFMAQVEDDQREMMGDRMYAAFTGGQFDFRDISRRIPNKTWGDSLQPRSLTSLLRAA